MIVEARRNRPASVESNGFVSPVLGNFGLFAALISVGAEVELFRFTLKVEPFFSKFFFFHKHTQSFVFYRRMSLLH